MRRKGDPTRGGEVGDLPKQVMEVAAAGEPVRQAPDGEVGDFPKQVMEVVTSELKLLPHMRPRKIAAGPCV